MLVTFRQSQHLKMVWHVANISATRRACRTRGIYQATCQTVKWAWGSTTAADHWLQMLRGSR